MIVGRTHGIPRRVGKLEFDVIVRESLLVKDRRGEAAKAVARHPPLVSKAL